MNHTIRERILLKKLDLTVYNGNNAIVGTQFGDATVRTAGTGGYVAEIGDGEIPESFAYGATPAMALLNLGDVIRREQAATQTARIIEFPKAQTQTIAGYLTERNWNPNTLRRFLSPKK